MSTTTLGLAAAFCAAASGVATAALIMPPPVRLRVRLRPYLVAARSRLGRPVGRGDLVPAAQQRMAATVAALRSRFLGQSDRGLQPRLRGSGLWPGSTDAGRLRSYRTGVAVAGFAGSVVGVFTGLVTGGGARTVLLLAALGAVGAVSLWRGRVDRATRARRDRMRLELATVDQMLAMWVRVGGGVLSAARMVVTRGQGEVVGEIAEALRLHHSGLSAGEAFRRIAELTPEPHARRCYQALAGAEERGSDVATALLVLAGDVRADRRETMRRQATRRRAAMLFPIVAVLGPVLVLFVALPVPWIVLRSIG